MEKNQTISQIRSKNLKRILEEEFLHNKDAMAEKIGVRPGTLTKYLNPNSIKRCKAPAARKIEASLELTDGYLDYDHSKTLETYYISLTIDNQYSFEIIQSLKSQSAVQECHLLIGEHDVLLKVNVENYLFLDLLISHISRLPGVKGSSSYPAISSLSWQRSQPEDMNILKRKDETTVGNGLDQFVHKKINYHFSAIKELERGDIVVKKSDSISFHSKEIIVGAKENIRSTKYLGMKVASQVEYIKKEKELIEQGVVSKRIIIIPNNTVKRRFREIQKEYEEYEEMGCAVKFIFDSDWKPTNSSEYPEYFTIVDQSYIAIRRETRKSLIVKRSERKIEEYLEVFESNWKIGLDFPEVEALAKSTQYHGK